MQTKTNTFIHYAATFIIIVAFVGVLCALAAAIMMVGIFWAFEILFSIGWWASLLVMLSVAGIYIAALFAGCKLIEKGNS